MAYDHTPAAENDYMIDGVNHDPLCILMTHKAVDDCSCGAAGDAEESQAEIGTLWSIYLNSCVCHMDYGTGCSCSANGIAEARLRELLGDDWHETCRLRYSPGITDTIEETR